MLQLLSIMALKTVTREKSDNSQVFSSTHGPQIGTEEEVACGKDIHVLLGCGKCIFKGLEEANLEDLR